MRATSYRQGLLDLIEALPRALPVVMPMQRWNPREDWLSCERLDIELHLLEQSFCVSHSLAPELQGNAVLECRFGPLPAERTREVMRRLLAVNLQCAVIQPSGFGRDVARGDILLSTPLNLDHTTPAILAERIATNALLAAYWRSNFFLDASSSVDVVNQFVAHRAPFARA